jgi:hypothetical protein
LNFNGGTVTAAGAHLVRRDAESLEQVRVRRLTLAGELGIIDPDELAAPLLHPVDEHRVDGRGTPVVDDSRDCLTLRSD